MRLVLSLVSLGSLLLLSGCGGDATTAGGPPPEPAGTATTAGLLPADATEARCPVMAGNKVDIQKATTSGLYADHEGNRYFFCCEGCPEQFKADPAKFAGADHIAVPTN